MLPKINDLIQKVKKYCGKSDMGKIQKAYAFADMAHRGQLRKSGDPYIVHPLRAALTLSEMKMDASTICAALLHDVPEDTNYTLIDIEKRFDSKICQLVMGVTKLGRIQYRGVEKFVSNLRKMFVSASRDVRVIIIKMADRLDNMRSLDAMPEEKRKRISLEVLEIYLPIADRLSMGVIGGNLEDLAFPHAYPKEFRWYIDHVFDAYQERIEYVNKIKDEYLEELKASKIKIISVYPKKMHFYKLYKDLFSPDNSGDISRIYDLVSLCLIVPVASDCYQVFGMIHKKWMPRHDYVKDYIAFPKPNHYQAIHTAVITDESHMIEFQIRTPEMEEWADWGIATHWMHAGKKRKFFSRLFGTKKQAGYPVKLDWLDEVVELQKEVNDKQYLDLLKIDALHNRILVFTPEGHVINLPEGATPVDFAYTVHNDDGHKCGNVKINNMHSPLDVPLKNGDLVEIILDENRKGPDETWLNFVKTAIAREKIKSYYTKNEQQ